MARYILKRLLMLIPVLLGISFIVLILIDITPGDPARILLGGQASEERVEALREEMGLNEPIPVRYVKFLWGAVQGDFGNSFVSKLPVFDEIMMRFPYTLFLVTLSLAIAILLGSRSEFTRQRINSHGGTTPRC
jgi:peptide/nickel transport system permease protein